MPVVVSDVSSSGKGAHRFPKNSLTVNPESYSDVWLVQETTQSEEYSNGLRIDNSFLGEGAKRFYQVLERKRDLQPSVEWRSQPVGIVYHTTESRMAPFASDQNDTLQRLAHSLLANLKEQRSYNFVVDRFGRVFRVVEELSAANHAGNSVWADAEAVYVNLNNSFLGIAFEAVSDAGEAGSSINRAQMHAGLLLTEMLRSKYKIPVENCVTHAQVSVNPSNMLIGYHTDWAKNFPFEAMGLPNNYEVPLPAITEFGFEYDSLFRKAMGSGPWNGILMAEKQLVVEAAGRRRSVGQFRSALHDRYRKLYSGLKLTGALEEPRDATNSN
jgi:hypothetical protein